jgi:hypothetical protein
LLSEIDARVPRRLRSFPYFAWLWPLRSQPK